MLNHFFIFITALFMVIRGATMATKYSSQLAANFRLSKYTIGFLIIAVISILPETFISINASLENMPSFGLGTLFGSNVADLTLVFAGIIFFSKRSLKVESKILKNQNIYPFLLLLPLVLGLDGSFNRLEGIALIIVGVIFYYVALKNGADTTSNHDEHVGKLKNVLLLIFSMAVMLIGAHFSVTSATSIAHSFGVNPVLIGMLVVGLGTTMPEFFFSLKSAKNKDDSLAMGDILGTVLADATIVVGILALMSPFSFSPKIIYVTGIFMVVASIALFHFMRTGRTLSKRESYILIFFWLIFVLTEFITNK